MKSSLHSSVIAQCSVQLRRVTENTSYTLSYTVGNLHKYSLTSLNRTPLGPKKRFRLERFSD